MKCWAQGFAACDLWLVVCISVWEILQLWQSVALPKLGLMLITHWQDTGRQCWWIITAVYSISRWSSEAVQSCRWVMWDVFSKHTMSTYETYTTNIRRKHYKNLRSGCTQQKWILIKLSTSVCFPTEINIIENQWLKVVFVAGGNSIIYALNICAVNSAAVSRLHWIFWQ